jgi:hypothetical protein
MTILPKIATITLASILLTSLSTTAYSFNYSDDEPMIFTYQNKAGYWFGCGPVQCINGYGDKIEEETMDLMAHDDHGSWSRIGFNGRCKVYSGSGDLNSYDNQPKKLIRLMKKRC